MTHTWLSVVPLTPFWLFGKSLAAESKRSLIMVCLRRDVRVQVLTGFSWSSALLAGDSATGVVDAQYALASIPYSRTAPYHPRFITWLHTSCSLPIYTVHRKSVTPIFISEDITC